MRYRKIPNLGSDYMQTIERVNLLERIVQAIGFTPDFPYTLNVSDGTRNRVLIGKIGTDYGIKIVNNAGVEIVFADGHISATGITTGTLDASVVNVTNLNASNIITGTLSATKIVGGTLNASLMTVTNLSASSIITGSMSGDRITARTLKANRIETNAITADELSVGEIITQSAQIKNAIITNAKIADLNAGKITAGTLDVITLKVDGLIYSGNLNVGGSGAGYLPYLIIKSTDTAAGSGAYLRFGSVSGSRIWSDSSNRIGINSLGNPMYIYVDSYEAMVIRSGGHSGLEDTVRFTLGAQLGNEKCLYFYDNSEQYIKGYSNKLQFRTNTTGDFVFAQGGTDRCVIDNNIWTGNNLYTDGNVHSHDVYYDNLIHNSSAFEGDPFPVMNTLKGKNLKGKKTRIVELDHKAVHSILKKNRINRDGTETPGMCMSDLVMVQNEAILQLKARLEVLEAKN